MTLKTETEWMTPVVILLPPKELALINRERKQKPKSQYLREIILKRNK